MLLGQGSLFPCVLGLQQAWHQLRPSPHFLRWEAKVRMQGMKRFPSTGKGADFLSSWSVTSLWLDAQLKLRGVVEVGQDKLISRLYTWKRLPCLQATSSHLSSSSRERENGSICPFSFFPSHLSFTIRSPFYPGSVSGASLAYQGSWLPRYHCCCIGQAVCLQHYKNQVLPLSKEGNPS